MYLRGSHERKHQLQLEYAEFLGLPLAFETFSPLSLVVAHKVHGRKVRTGWPSNPRSLEDRRNSSNNILIESRMKHKFSAACYHALKELVRGINLTHDIATKGLVISP